MSLTKTILATAAIGAAALAATHLTTSRARADGAAPARSSTVQLHVEGMTCPSCKVAVRTALTRLDGVRDAKVDVAAKSATVAYDPARVTPAQLADAVNRLGYQASLPARSGPGSNRATVAERGSK